MIWGRASERFPNPFGSDENAPLVALNNINGNFSLQKFTALRSSPADLFAPRLSTALAPQHLE
jgi:hypothetical protein